MDVNFTPSRKRPRAGSASLSATPARKVRISDRYIPLRSDSSDLIDYTTNFALLPDDADDGKAKENTEPPASTKPSDLASQVFDIVLKNELAGTSATPKASRTPTWLDDKIRLSTAKKNLFQYQSHGSADRLQSQAIGLCDLSESSQELLCTPRKAPRKIPKVPYKVLDAPDLQDDFYLNLVDWSQQNVLAVGLGRCVYLWSACTSQVTNLCDLSSENDEVASVCWMGKGQHLTVGTNKGRVQIWDVQAGKKIRTMPGHSLRIGTIAAKTYVLATGSRDRSILMRDVRVKDNYTSILNGHKQEVCGLKWSPDRQHLASGGNDNRLYVWNSNSTSRPMLEFLEHKAAVKALAWSPHQSGLLTSGGGTADRCIRFWNTTTGQPLNCIDTGSQVCNIVWSKNSNELVSTHGYSQNQIVVWKYPSMTQIATLTGHTYRVLYLAMSPDGETIVTGAGDETLRFWSVFNKTRGPAQTPSVITPWKNIR